MKSSGEQESNYLPRLASGEALGGFMLTEPHAGSDAASLSTRYRDAGDHWVLHGAKAWITNGGEYTIERLYRDARVATIYEGTSEVQRMVIARALREEAAALG